MHNDMAMNGLRRNDDAMKTNACTKKNRFQVQFANGQKQTKFHKNHFFHEHEPKHYYEIKVIRTKYKVKIKKTGLT